MRHKNKMPEYLHDLLDGLKQREEDTKQKAEWLVDALRHLPGEPIKNLEYLGLCIENDRDAFSEINAQRQVLATECQKILNRIEAIKEAIRDIMDRSNQPFIVGQRCKLILRTVRPQLDIYAPEEVPATYYTDAKIDRKRIWHDLIEQICIPGCRLKQRKKLHILRDVENK